jgi:hypothetical protein
MVHNLYRTAIASYYTFAHTSDKTLHFGQVVYYGSHREHIVIPLQMRPSQFFVNIMQNALILCLGRIQGSDCTYNKLWAF